MHSTMRQSNLINRVVLVIVLLVAVWIGNSSCQQLQQHQSGNSEDEQHADMFSTNQPRKWCSKQLNVAMKHVCAFRERFKPRINKKSQNYDLDIDGFDVDRIGAGSRTAYDDYFGESTYPLLVPAQQQGSRVPRGIIEECCKQACHISDLIKYCRPL